MNISNRAFRVTFAALMLTLASQAGAVGQSAAETSQVKDAPLAAAATASSESQQQVNKSKSNIKNNRTASSERQQQVNRSKSNIKNNRTAAAADIDPPKEPATSDGLPAVARVKGHVVGNAGNAKQAETIAPACATKTKDGRPASCPKGINQAGIK